jgi:hypothetical protein
MADQTFVGNPADIHMGPAALFWGTEQRCLGYTLNDSVAISITHTPTPITPDQASLPIKDIITEMEATITVTLGEVNEANLNMIPGAENGVFSDPIGIDMKEIAQQLTIVPIDDSDKNIYTFPKASPSMNGELSFVKNTPQGLSLTFKAYVDETDEAVKKPYLKISQKSA